jgi:hypothetical protein
MTPLAKRTRIAALCGVTLGLMGAHPAPKGSELTISAGQNVTEFRTIQTNPQYRYVSNGLAVHVGGRVRFDNNFTLAAQTDIDHGIISGSQQISTATAGDSLQTETQVGDIQWTGGTAMRAGWHGKLIGGELGMAIVNLPEAEQHLFPSATGWIGIPKFLYVWGGTFTGPITRARALNEPMVGLGHKGKNLTFWWGTHVEARLQNLPWQLAPVPNPLPGEKISPSAIPFLVGTTIRVNDDVRLGLEYGAGDRSPEQTVQDSRFSMVVHVTGGSLQSF